MMGMKITDDEPARLISSHIFAINAKTLRSDIRKYAETKGKYGLAPKVFTLQLSVTGVLQMPRFWLCGELFSVFDIAATIMIVFKLSRLSHRVYKYVISGLGDILRTLHSATSDGVTVTRGGYLITPR
jgi:hypothetical protein